MHSIYRLKQSFHRKPSIYQCEEMAVFVKSCIEKMESMDPHLIASIFLAFLQGWALTSVVCVGLVCCICWNFPAAIELLAYAYYFSLYYLSTWDVKSLWIVPVLCTRLQVKLLTPTFVYACKHSLTTKLALSFVLTVSNSHMTLGNEAMWTSTLLELCNFKRKMHGADTNTN